MINKIVAFFLAFFAMISAFFSGESRFITAKTNVFYGNHERRIMDLYLPKGAKGEVDMILMIHGGAWIAGDRSGYTRQCKDITRRGKYATLAINYRYIDEKTTISDELDDITLALKKAQSLAQKEGIHLNRMMLYGASAGAHLSLLYAYSRFAESPVEPACVFSLSAPTDLTDEEYFNCSLWGNDGLLENVLSYAGGVPFKSKEDFGTAKEALWKVSPLAYSKTSVPTILCHGEKDDIVPYSNALSLKKALEENGTRFDFVSFPNSGHGLENDADCFNRAYRLSLEYMNEYMS